MNKENSFQVRPEVSSYQPDSSAWLDDIFESFPRDVNCPVCRKGIFAVTISGAVAKGDCSNCGTSVPYQFYDTRYTYLDDLQKL